MSQKKSILITGGLGFIGAHLCRALIRESPGNEITIVDNLSAKPIGCEDLYGKAQILTQDLLGFNWQSQIFDEIYHLASPVGSLAILKRNGLIAKDILDLTYKITEMTLAMRAKLLYLSSSEIYGYDGINYEENPVVVDNRRGTRKEYALGKLLSEHILFNLASQHNLDFRICRPFNAIGVEQSAEKGFVVPTFIERAIANEDVPLYYGGVQKRSFCYITDIVSGIISVQNKGQSREIYNIGNPNNLITINELAEKIIKMTASNSRKIHMDPKEIYGDQYVEACEKIPDITKVRNHTGWMPAYDLTKSLLEIINCLRGRSKQMQFADSSDLLVA